MSKLSSIPRNLALVLCIIPFLAACGETPSETPTQTKVISGKIPIAKEGGAVPETTDKGAAAMPAAETSTPTTDPRPVVTASPAETQAAENEVETQQDPDPYNRIAYNFEGKVDPFAPLLREQPEKIVGSEPSGGVGEEEEGRWVQESVVERQIPKTPLEQVDVSQLKLVAIIRSDRGNRAMVQDASGKGYILNKGTYIGIHSGFVTDITQDRVIIEETARDSAPKNGMVKLRKRELELQKPVGEI